MFNDKLVTVWSAPNYCYRCGNIASIMQFTTVDQRTPVLFQAVPDSERVIPPLTPTPYFLWSILVAHLYGCKREMSVSRLYGITWFDWPDPGWYHDGTLHSWEYITNYTYYSRKFWFL